MSYVGKNPDVRTRPDSLGRINLPGPVASPSWAACPARCQSWGTGRRPGSDNYVTRARRLLQQYRTGRPGRISDQPARKYRLARKYRPAR